MRATINVEFTDDELRKYAEDVARRVGLNFIHDVIGHLSGVKINPDTAAMFAQVIASAVGSAFVSKPPARETPPSTPDADFAPRTKCERVETSAHLEEGWICCSCSVYNVLARTKCRNCDHGRCDVVVTPPPAPES